MKIPKYKTTDISKEPLFQPLYFLAQEVTLRQLEEKEKYKIRQNDTLDTL